MGRVTHFDAKGFGLYSKPGMAECGESWFRERETARYGVTFKNALCLTQDPSRVTCKRCIKTKAYREAVGDGGPVHDCDPAVCEGPTCYAFANCGFLKALEKRHE